MMIGPQVLTSIRSLTRRICVGLLPALTLSLGLASFSTAQGYDGWVYRSDLGGWLDVNTGLVWGKTAQTAYGGSWSWNGANNIFLPKYRSDTGIAAWRLPTAIELEDANQKGGAAFLLGDIRFDDLWGSNTKGSKLAYISDWGTTGANSHSGYYSKTSYANAITVYRAP